MTAIEKIEQFLNENTSFKTHIAGTGTLYIEADDLTIRVSDHEPNYSARRPQANKCFYTRTADNMKFDACDVVGDILDWLEEEIDFDFDRDLEIKLMNYDFCE